MPLNMRYWIFALLFLIGAQVIAQDEVCLPAYDNCEFYHCANQELGCGPRNYLLRFGYKYCQLFVRKNSRFTPLAQDVLRDIRYCLQVKLNEEPRLTCGSTKVFASQHHLECYVQRGFCELPFSDKFLIFQFIQRALIDADYRQTMWNIYAACKARH